MTSTSGALAAPSPLESLEAEVTQYKEERERLRTRIEELEKRIEQPAGDQELKKADRETLNRLLDKDIKLLDNISTTRNLLLQSSVVAAGPAAGTSGTVLVHVKTGPDEKSVKVAAVKGQVSLLPLERDLDVTFVRIAVMGSSSSSIATISPQYQKFSAYDMAVQPGDEVIVEAKPKNTGGNWLVRLLGL